MGKFRRTLEAITGVLALSGAMLVGGCDKGYSPSSQRAGQNSKYADVYVKSTKTNSQGIAYFTDSHIGANVEIILDNNFNEDEFIKTARNVVERGPGGVVKGVTYTYGPHLFRNQDEAPFCIFLDSDKTNILYGNTSQAKVYIPTSERSKNGNIQKIGSFTKRRAPVNRIEDIPRMINKIYGKEWDIVPALEKRGDFPQSRFVGVDDSELKIMPPNENGEGIYEIRIKGDAEFPGFYIPTPMTIAEWASRAKSSLQNLNVHFIDRNGSETFIVEDPRGVYLPSLDIFPHNSSHGITMYVRGQTPEIAKYPSGSLEAKAVDNYADYAEKHYKVLDDGVWTIDELNKHDKAKLQAAGFFIGQVPGFSFFTKGAVELSKLSDLESNLEGYHVQRLLPMNGITTELRILTPIEKTPRATYTPQVTKSREFSGSTKISFTDGQNIIFVSPETLDTKKFFLKNLGSQSLSADGREAVFQSLDGKTNIFRADLSTGSLKQITKDDFYESSPEFSPDGTKIVFDAVKTGKSDIFVADRNGVREKRVTFNPGMDVFPSWHPNGRDIVYSFSNGEGYNLAVVDENGNNFRQLTNMPGDEVMAKFSPDGTKIVFTQLKNPKIHIMDSNGRNIRRITNTNETEMCPVWSPDGNEIAFILDSRNDSLDGIYLVNPNSRKQETPRRLIEAKDPKFSLSWSRQKDE